MKMIKFVEQYSKEENCKSHLRNLRMKEGITCKKCNGQRHYWLSAKWQWQCVNCRFRTSLKSGTVMENSRLNYRTWFMIFYVMTSTKKGLSACELQRQLGHKRYSTIWSIMHRIREAMGNRDDLYQLNDMVEFDEGYFEKEVSDKVKSNLKRGRGSQRQANVAVMAESTPLENIETGRVSSQCRYFKMKVLKTHKSEEIIETLKESIDKKSFIFTDKSTSYNNMSDYIETHINEKSTKETTKGMLKWVHIAISNAKKNLLGTYHKVSGKYLQNYLNEFTYKLNRRHFDSLFDRILIASVFPYWQTNE